MRNTCPACDRTGPNSVLDHVREKIAAFDAVAKASSELAGEWAEKGWGQLMPLEQLARKQDDAPQMAAANQSASNGTLDGDQARRIAGWVKTLVDRSKSKLEAFAKEKQQLERVLPPKLTAVVEKAEAARRLQSNLADLKKAKEELAGKQAELARIERVRQFLNNSCALYSQAESQAGARRLKAIEPLCRDIFAAIVFQDIVPALEKREGSEELSISLADFWTLHDVSAQAVLLESYRNAFAISVYLAAASLYCGGAKFPEVRADPNAAGQKYGRRDPPNPFNYMVKGTGKVVELHTESQAGTADVQIPGLAEKVVLQIGPVVHPGCARSQAKQAWRGLYRDRPLPRSVQLH